MLRKSLLAMCLALAAGAVSAYDLAEVKSRGVLRVAVYKDFAPFSDEGKGIDNDLAAKLAEKLGVKVSFLPFDGDENMDDDLRNMVWKGHYLGYGPADVMMHAPVDKAFMERNDKVQIFAPYFRETVQLMFNTEVVPKVESMLALEGLPVGVEDASIASIALLSYEGGKFRNNVRHYKSMGQAVADLKAGKLAAVLGMRSQLEAAKGGATGVVMANPPLPGLPQAGWVLGLAVKKEYEDLAKALQKAMNELDADGQLNRVFEQHGVRRLAPL